MRIVRQCHRWPREVVQPPSLEIFKHSLDETLSNLVWSAGWRCCEQEIGLETPCDPFQQELPCHPKNFCSVKPLIMYSVSFSLSCPWPMNFIWFNYNTKEKPGCAFLLKKPGMFPEMLAVSNLQARDIYHSFPCHKLKNAGLPTFIREGTDESL